MSWVHRDEAGPLSLATLGSDLVLDRSLGWGGVAGVMTYSHPAPDAS